MRVAVLGRIGYDLYAEEHGVPLERVTRFTRYLGGSSANLAVGLKRLGLNVGMISCLGEDTLSQYLLDYLAEEQVDTRFVRRKAGYLPSFCLTEVSPPEHFPQVFYRDRAADTQVDVGDEEKEFIESTRLFATNGTSLCASPSREATFRAMEWAKQAGVRVAFDVDYRSMSWRSPEEAGVYARLALPFIDILIANPLEIALLAETDRVEVAVERLLERGVPLVVAKLGSEGTRAVTNRESLFLPPYPVEVLSTIGAGDGFASGFLFAWTRGDALGEALRFGNAAAAIVVSRLMCSEAMPRLEEVEALLRRHPEIEPVPAT